MANILTHAARHAKAALLAAGIELGHAKIQEVLAALLGYHTYSALKQEEDDQELEHHLSDAEFVILHQELGVCRAADVSELPGEVVPRCIAALEECLAVRVLPNTDAYLERHGTAAAVAALTNLSTQGLHLGADWSSSVKPSTGLRFSVQQPVWESRHLWHVHAHVSLQSIAPVAEPLKIDVVLLYAKAGRSGLILKGVKPVVDTTATIGFMRVDLSVQRDDASIVRPWVAIVLDTYSDTVLGSAVSLTDDLALLGVNALTNAINSTAPGDNEEGNGSKVYRITKLEIDHSYASARVKETAQLAGIEIIDRNNRIQWRGRAEAIMRSIYMPTAKNPPSLLRVSSLSDIETVTEEQFVQLFQISCKHTPRRPV